MSDRGLVRHSPVPKRRSWIVGGAVGLIALASSLARTPLDEPPRFDGAGYAAVATGLIETGSYRDASHPERPRHGHYPPGYPLVLAALWSVCGRASTTVAHLSSAVCTGLAAWAAWRWLAGMLPRRAALWLGLALAVNWTWGRVGGTIQSEPLFLLLIGLSALTARGGRGLKTGLLGGAAILTRHAGVTWVAAWTIDLALRRRWVAAGVTTGIAGLMVLPWIAWTSTVPAERVQASLMPRTTGALAATVVENAIFYVRRLPDQIVGPFVEVATMFARDRSPWLRRAADAWALAATSLIAWGWLRSLGTSRRRPAALAALTGLALLLVWPFTEAGRFLIPLVPCLLLGATEGLARVLAWRTVRKRVRLRPRSAAALLVLAVSVPYSAYDLRPGRSAEARRAHADYDAACEFVASQADRPGPILARHGAEAWWLSGRLALAPAETDEPEDLDRILDRPDVAFLIVDRARYANGTPGPLARYVGARPGRVRRVWSQGRTEVYAVVRPETNDRGESGAPTRRDP